MNSRILTDREFETEALRIVDAAKENNLTLRLLGALAIRIHCPRYNFLHEDLKRKYTDLDFAAYKRQNDGILRLLTRLGYACDLRALTLHGTNRMLFQNNRTGLKLDVFYDRLEFCHTIDFAKNRRLEIDYPTISVSDLLLEKMQIVNITKKDIIDTSILLVEHDMGSSDKDLVNTNYLTDLLSQDWGFYYTVTINLGKVKESLARNEKVPSPEKSIAAGRIDTIIDAIEKAAKSTRWKFRARIGPSKKWYKDVEEITR